MPFFVEHLFTFGFKKLAISLVIGNLLCVGGSINVQVHTPKILIVILNSQLIISF
jgi:hypothetical protein